MKIVKNNDRQLALNAIFSVVVDKKSLNDFDFQNNSFATTLSFGTIRYYHHLNKVVHRLLKKEFEKKNLDIFCILLLGAYQIIYIDTPNFAAINESVNLAEEKWAKSLVNAVLRKITTYPLEPDYSHPKWLVKKIKNQYPADFAEIFKQNNTKAPMTIRVNGNTDYYQKGLLNLDIKSKKVAQVKSALILEQPMPVNNLPEFANGSCYVQDASAQLAGQLLIPKDGDIVLDACCAPGGKTTHLATLNSKAKIIALDNNQLRLTRVQENIDRMQCSNVVIKSGNAINTDWWEGVLFDKILLDAPCSATGVIRRHPDIKLLRKATDINKLAKIQAQMLNNLWQILKVGGEFLYATCSILEQENSQQIENFLMQNKDAKLVKFDTDWGAGEIGRQQLPSANFDGFYYAKLIKTNLDNL